jgi:hypothetical protein
MSVQDVNLHCELGYFTLSTACEQQEKIEPNYVKVEYENCQSSQGHENDCSEDGFHILKAKYMKKDELEIDRVTLKKAWIYSWLFDDLREWENTEQLKFGLESDKLNKRIHTFKDRVVKLREQLAYLQTQTVSPLPIFTPVKVMCILTLVLSSLFGDSLKVLQQARDTSPLIATGCCLMINTRWRKMRKNLNIVFSTEYYPMNLQIGMPYFSTRSKSTVLQGIRS